MSPTTRENVKKPPENNKKQEKNVLLVAQELKLARVLAGNNKTARDRALKSLKKWFQNRSTAMPFSEDDFLRLWKGLFYSMWMSDKLLIQEECAENIASLVHALPLDTSLLFYKCGMTILMNEWFGIDQLRLDKFLMFVRRLLRQILFVLKNQNWTRDSVQKFSQVLSETILDTQRQKPIGLLMHFTEIYLEELAKVSDGEFPPHLMSTILDSFVKQLAFTDDTRIIHHIRKHIFIYLIRQSNLGLEYEEKYKAWRNLGFPGSIDSMKKVEADDDESKNEELETVEEEGDKVYDPRAGRVNVELPQLNFHSKAIARALSECKFLKETSSKSRKCLNDLTERFKKLASGIYPLGVKKIKVSSDDSDTNIRKAVNRLVKFDKKIKGKKNKKRKIQDDENDEIELRGGKKIKLDERLHKKVEEELNNIMKNPEKRKKMLKAKRKINDITESPPEKQAKEDDEATKVESIFRRNSGTWLVTKLFKSESKKQIIYPITGKSTRKKSELSSKRKRKSSDGSGAYADDKLSKGTLKPKKPRKLVILYPKNEWQPLANHDEPIIEENFPKPKIMFPSSRWDNLDDLVAIKAEESLKRSRFSLPANLIKNPFATPNSTPVKKVKINTKLNRSQDVQEHHAQILSSPAIPYDANKKPSKPLLKTPSTKSPINPFYTL